MRTKSTTTYRAPVTIKLGTNPFHRVAATFLGAFILLLSLGLATPAWASPERQISPVRVEKEEKGSDYIVVFRDAVSLSSRLRAEADLGVDPQVVFRNVFPGFVARLDREDVRRLEADPRVLTVEPDGRVTTQTSAPQDRQTPSWGLDRIDQRALPLNSRLVAGNNGFGVETYIIDTGVRVDHTQFSGRVNGEGFSAFPGGWNDCEGHGTHVAGTVAGSTYGVAPAAMVTAIRVLNCDGSGTDSTVIAGIDWMIGDHQAGEPAVGNMSLGGGRTEALNTAVERAVADGITMVVAAGNESSDACTKSPASAPSAVTVGSSTRTDEMSGFSNVGSCVDLFAPGSSIVSASYASPNAVETLSGTSMASPHVAGAAALLLSGQPSMSPATVTDRLVTSSTPGAVTGLQGCTMNRLLYVGSGPEIPGSPAPERPTLDDFADAENLTSLGGTNGVSSCATKEAGEPSHGPGSGASIWYRWTAPAAGTLTLNTSGSSFDTVLAVYTGSSVGSLTRWAQDDDSGGGTASRVSLPVTAGTTYSIAIDGYNGATGSTRIIGSLAGGGGPGNPTDPVRPVNDDFAAATRVNSWQSGVNTSNEGATAEVGESPHDDDAEAANGSIWYRWTAPSNGVLEIDTGSRWGLIIAAYTGSSLATLERVTTGWREMRVLVREGTEYKIVFDQHHPGAESDDIRITGSFTAAPANDDFDDAQVITSWGSNIAAPNTSATTEAGEPSHDSDFGEGPVASVWFEWTPPSNGILSLDASASSFSYPAIAVYTGSSVASLERIAGSTDDLRVQVRSDIRYRVAVDARSPRGLGDVRLSGSFVSAPKNDDFDDATPIDLFTNKRVGTLFGSSHQPGEPDHLNDGGVDALSGSIWFRWTAPLDMRVNFNVSCCIVDMITVYEGSSVDDLSKVASSGFDSAVGFSAQAGRTYSFAVSGWNDEAGRVDLRLRRRLAMPTLVKKPRSTTLSRTARFVFAGDAGARFECKLDNRPKWGKCNKVTIIRNLRNGEHSLEVRQVYGRSKSIARWWWWWVGPE